eukprot:scaffold60486_cov38-Phaeocystis_antarctica.AAC.2
MTRARQAGTTCCVPLCCRWTPTAPTPTAGAPEGTRLGTRMGTWVGARVGARAGRRAPRSREGAAYPRGAASRRHARPSWRLRSTLASSRRWVP